MGWYTRSTAPEDRKPVAFTPNGHLVREKSTAELTVEAERAKQRVDQLEERIAALENKQFVAAPTGPDSGVFYTFLARVPLVEAVHTLLTDLGYKFAPGEEAKPPSIRKVKKGAK